MKELQTIDIIKILEKLSRAEDPTNGSDLSHRHSILAQDEVQFALSSLVGALRNTLPPQATPAKVIQLNNRGKRWEIEELKKVKDDFLAGKAVKVIARDLGRSEQSIRHQLIKYNVPIEDHLPRLLN